MELVFLDAKSLGNIPDLKKLDQFGITRFYDYTPPEKLFERTEEVDIIITNKARIDRNVIDNAKHLKLICLSATGTDNVDVAYAEEKGIPVKNVEGYSSNSVAQFTFSALFYLLHQSRYYDDFVKNGNYAQQPLFTHIGPPFWELNGKRFGIIGLGNIGKKVAFIAQGFGCEISYFSTSGRNYDTPYQSLSLLKLLKSSDVVSIHAPLNENTRNLLDYEKIVLMKPSSYLINMGRGGIIDEHGLARALNEKKIAGAALDVTEKEPLAPDNPLMLIKEPENLYISPHIAWSSIESRKTLIEGICENIRKFINENS